MSRRPRPNKVFTPDAVPAQFNVLLDNFKRIEAIEELRSGAVDSEIAAKVNEILQALREVVQGRRN